MSSHRVPSRLAGNRRPQNRSSSRRSHSVSASQHAPQLARGVQGQLRKAHLHHLAVELRRLPALGKQRHLLRALRPLHHLDRAPPRGTLAVVDLAQVQHLALHHAPAAHAHVLHHAPVAVLLAVFEPFLAAHEHAPIVRLNERQINRVGRHYREFRGRFRAPDSCNSTTWVAEKKNENRQNPRRVGEVGLALALWAETIRTTEPRIV